MMARVRSQSAPISPCVSSCHQLAKCPKIPNHQRPRCAILIHSAKEEPCPRERERERARPRGTRQHSYSTGRIVMRGRKEELDVCFLISFTVRSSSVHDRDERFRKCRARSVLGMCLVLWRQELLLQGWLWYNEVAATAKHAWLKEAWQNSQLFYQTGTRGNAVYWGIFLFFFYVFSLFAVPGPR